MASVGATLDIETRVESGDLLIRSVTISYQPVSADRPGTVVCPPIQQYVMKLVVTDRMKRRGDRLETG